MPQSHRDHGVAGQRHWLLDKELSCSSNGRAARPAVLERSEPPSAPVLATATVTLPPRRNFMLLVAGLVAALLVYALLSSAAVVGALEEVLPSDDRGPVRITATFDEPAPRELSQLHTLLARTPAAARERGAPTSFTTTTTEKPAGPGPGDTDDGILPPLPPPPAPPPLLPEIELPPVKVPPRPELEAPKLPPLPDLSKSLSSPENEAGDGTRTRDPQLGRLTL
jgi:hypothetical protein